MEYRLSKTAEQFVHLSPSLLEAGEAAFFLSFFFSFLLGPREPGLFSGTAANFTLCVPALELKPLPRGRK